LRRVIPPQAIECLSLATRIIATFVIGEKYFTKNELEKHDNGE